MRSRLVADFTDDIPYTLCGLGRIMLGLGGAAGLTRYLSGMLYTLAPLDPPTYGVAILFATVALIASYLPARRATQVEPVVGVETRLGTKCYACPRRLDHVRIPACPVTVRPGLTVSKPARPPG